MTHPLEDTIGPTVGRIDAATHVERTKFAFSQIPDDVWPSVGILNGKFEGYRAVIVGGGPSLDWELIRKEADARDAGENVRIFAPNRSHDELIAHGITPDYGVVMDPALHVADYITPRDGVVYLVGSGVHWKVLHKFLAANARCMFWTPLYDVDAADAQAIHEAFPDRCITFVSGGSTVGLRLINIVMGWGMEPHLHGFDSAYLPNSKTLYAYDKPQQTREFCDATMVSRTTGRQFRFTANQHMVRQAMAFDSLLHRLPLTTVDGRHAPKKITVYGDGAIPWMAWLDGGDLAVHADPERMFSKYRTEENWDYQNDKACSKPFCDPLAVATNKSLTSSIGYDTSLLETMARAKEEMDFDSKIDATIADAQAFVDSLRTP